VARRFAFLLIWLALTPEIEGQIFHGHWSTPLTTIGTFLFRPIASIVPWDALVLLTLLAAHRGAGWSRVQPTLRSIGITVCSLLALWLWGVICGGSPYQTYFQLRAFVMGLFVTLLVLATCRNMAHIESLMGVVAFATVYRAFVLFLYYLIHAQYLPELPPVLTDHADSVLFVSGLFVIVINALERRKVSTTLWTLPSVALIITAIALNNRRIAWLGVGAALAMMYLLLPPGKVKRRITQVLIALSPLLLAYVIAGWGNSTGIFKPVGSISSMFGANQDASSIMRDIENYNLMRTLKTNPLLGLGFGREYIEEVRAYDISSIFPQYRYLPHNSLLGLLAFTGALGFTGVWQLVAVASYFHARVLRQSSKLRVPRIAALSSLLTLMMVTLEMWGDVGFNHLTVTTMMGLAVGLSGRVAAVTGVWPGEQPVKGAEPRTESSPRTPRKTVRIAS
jgi:hypothetical protein